MTRSLLTLVIIVVLLIPHVIIAYTILGVEEPLWSRQIKEVSIPPKPREGRVLIVDAGGGGNFTRIGDAVKAAEPGDTIVIMPGVYREEVLVESRPWLTIIGRDRERVILDGGGQFGNGIYVVFSPHVTIANLTVRNYLGNGIFYVNSDYFNVSYVTAENNRVYGINFLASEKGIVSHVVASGSGDSGIYVGEVTENCECVIEYSEAYNNSLGYSGTRANGVTIRYSYFHDNAIGIAPNTLLPDLRLFILGKWPLLLWASNNVIEHNIIENNNNREIKAAGFAASYGVPIGVGIAMIGSHSNVVRNNTIRGNVKWGVAEWYFLVPSFGNRYEGNRFEGNGVDYWSDGWSFFACSVGERATGDVPPPCDTPAFLRITIPNPIKDLELLLGVEVPGTLSLAMVGVFTSIYLAVVGRPRISPERYARRWRRAKRLLSSFIDLLVVSNIYLLIATLLIVFGFGITEFRSVVDGMVSLTLLLLPLAYMIFTIVWIVYGLVTEALKGATLGKLLTGTRVLYQGIRPKLWRIALKNIARLVDLLFFGLVGLLSILITGRSVGEHVSGTRVEEWE